MSSTGFRMIVLAHYSRYPLSQIEDLYKLTHQAALGSEHAVKDIKTAREGLVREMAQLAAFSVEPLIDEISPDECIVRVHLKPYLEAGGDPENLLQAFIRTANEYQGSVELLGQYWKSIEGMSQQGEIMFPPDSLRSFIERMESLSFPAVHHSAKYQGAYHPSYRVIARDFLSKGTGVSDLYSK